jgi:hypothetical protein
VARRRGGARQTALLHCGAQTKLHAGWMVPTQRWCAWMSEGRGARCV